MTRLTRLGLFAVGSCLAAVPAAAGVVVVGTSPGRSCYEAALNRNSSAAALSGCDAALALGTLTAEDEVATYVNRGIVKLLGGQIDASIADFDRALLLDPDEPEAYLNKGSALLNKDSRDQAISLFSQALERRTGRPELAYYGRAVAHEESGNVKAAYSDYLRAQQAAPKWALPVRELSRFQRRSGGRSTL